jgi:hypothetical protein
MKIKVKIVLLFFLSWVNASGDLSKDVRALPDWGRDVWSSKDIDSYLRVADQLKDLNFVDRINFIEQESNRFLGDNRDSDGVDKLAKFCILLRLVYDVSADFGYSAGWKNGKGGMWPLEITRDGVINLVGEYEGFMGRYNPKTDMIRINKKFKIRHKRLIAQPTSGD